MGYIAARGGLDAIAAAERLVKRARTEVPSAPLGIDQLADQLRLAVDRVQGEAGLWAPQLAAQALRQAEGDVIDAAQLLRAHRSLLPRLAYCETVDVDELDILRRVVPAYRNPPGPQLLGRTVDYSGRLLEPLEAHVCATPVWNGAAGDAHAAGPATTAQTGQAQTGQAQTGQAQAGQARTGRTQTGEEPGGGETVPAGDRRPRRLLFLLREMDLLVDRRRAAGDDPEPFDITRRPARPPAPRSARLATMARAETGALVNLWYRNILGTDSHLHEVTLGEVRHGYLPVPVTHPHTGNPVCIGRVRVSEAEAIEDLDGLDEDRSRLDAGYGLCLGHNERKAIAMANLDISVERDRGRTSLEQSILATTDGLDASGFLEHLKLPHYVTFRSIVDRKLAVRARLGAPRVPLSPDSSPPLTATKEQR